MIYRIFKFLANIAIRVFYGKIEVSGMKNVPEGVPLLIASNHPNGFLEPIIIASLFPRPLHFMVRGDVFRKKWLKPILVNTNQIPIFRFKDGFAELRKNNSNLQEAYNALDKEAAIILFVEGGTINIKKLRPFQKGMARMAASYLDRENTREDLHILPVAINFVSPFILRSRVVLNIGEAYEAKSCFNDPAKRQSQIKKLTSDLYDQIKPMAFHVSDDNRQSLLNKTLKFAEGFFPIPFFPIVDFKPKMWKYLKSVCETIDGMDSDTAKNFEIELDKLGSVNINDLKRNSKWPLFNGLLSILLFIPAMIGLVLNIIPGALSQLLAKKVLNSNNTVFKASIILSSGVGFYTVYYLFAILVLSIFYGIKSLMFILAWPLGFVYLFWKNMLRSSFLKSKYTLTKDQKNRLNSLFSKNNIILAKP